jgi:hypothetical protein
MNPRPDRRAGQAPRLDLGLRLGLRSTSWRVAAQSKHANPRTEVPDLQGLWNMARPGLEPRNTTIFRESSQAAPPARNACKSTALTSRCVAAMFAVWRCFARVWDLFRRAESQTSVGVFRRANGRWRHSRPRSAAPRSEAVTPTRRRTPGGPAGRRARRIDAHLRPHRRVSDRRRDPPARGGLRGAHAGGSRACRRSVAVSRMLSHLQYNQPDAFRPWPKARAFPLGAVSGISA